jgi:hypothetical protein
VKTERKSVSSAHKLDGHGKLKEHAPRSEHVHLHQDIGNWKTRMSLMVLGEGNKKKKKRLRW